MPRNSSGTYTLPQSPFVPGTVISSAAVNSNFADIATALTGSIAADGSTSITAPIQFLPGTVNAPGIAFVTDSTSGVYLAGAGIVGIGASGGVAAITIDSVDIGPGKNGNQLKYGNGAVPSPVGSVLDFAGSATPIGWFLCFGQSLASTSYPELFNVIGTTYGGSGGNFNLPDCRGRFTAGVDNMGGTAANRITSAGSGVAGATLGAVGGSQNFTLAQANLPVISLGTYSPGTIALDPTGGLSLARWDGTVHNYTGGSGVTSPASDSGHMSTIASNSLTVTLPSFTPSLGGSAVPIATVPPVVMFNKIIFAGRP